LLVSDWSDVLADSSRRFAEAGLDLDAVLSTATRSVAEVIGDYCCIRLLNRDKTLLESVADYHKNPESLAIARAATVAAGPQPADEGLTGEVIQTGKTLHMPVVSQAEKRKALKPAYVPYFEKVGVHSLVMAPVRARGEVLGVVFMTRDKPGSPYGPEDVRHLEQLADRAALAIDGARLYRAAQQAIRAREQFLSIASHELMTPIAALRLRIEAQLEEGEKRDYRFSPDESRAATHYMARQVRRLTMLAHNLLDVSRLAAGPLQVIPRPCDLVALVHEVVQRFALDTERSGGIRVMAHPPVVGRWDPERLDQVITNLVSNAIRYGQGRPIDIEVLGDEHSSRLVVTDHGIGIEAEQLERIFDPFERATSARHYGGLGLGLYIVREIVTASGGRVDVRSRPGEGSTFTVTLPLRSPGSDPPPSG
jgi:signal transduction histidine kinase